MAFKVGAVYGEAILDTKKWMDGTDKMDKGISILKKSVLGFTAVAGAALTTFGVLATKEANKFEKSLSNVDTLLDDTTVSIEELSHELLGLDSSLGSTTELTDGLYQAISAGADPATDAIQTVVDAAIFAKAALTDTATAVDVLTTATNAYGSEIMSTNKASDIFFTTIKQGKITGEELASTIGQSIPLFASLKIPLEELSSGMAAMTKQGISASEATTQLNAIVNSFLKPSLKLQEALKGIGFESASAFLETEGLAGAMKFLEEQSGGNNDILAELIPNVRGLKGVMALTGEGAEEFTKILNAMENASGSTQIAFDKQQKTFETLGNEFNKTLVLVGEELFPAIEAGAIIVTDLTRSFNGLFQLGIEDKIQNQQNAFNTLVVELNDVNTEESRRQQILEELNNSYGDILGNIDAETASTEELTMAIQEANKQYLNRLIIAKEQDKIEKIQKRRKKELEDIAKAAGDIARVDRDALNKFAHIQGFVNASTEKRIKLLRQEKDRLVEVSGTEEGLNDIRLRSKIGELDTFTGKYTAAQNKLTRQENQLIMKSKGLNELIGQRDGLLKVLNLTMEDVNGTTKGTGDSIRTLGNEIVNTKGPTEEATKSFIGLWGDAFEQWKVDFDKADFSGKFEMIRADVLDNFTFISGQLGSIMGDIFGVVDQGLQNELDQLVKNGDDKTRELENQKEEKLALIDNSFEEQRTKLQEQLNNNLITEAEFNDSLGVLESQRAADKESTELALNEKLNAEKKKQTAKENALRKKQFEAEQANQISQIWIQYAIGLVGLWAQSLAQLGPIAGPIAAGILTAGLTGVAIAQTAVIANQEFVPARKDGGMASGLTRVNEEGGEIQRLADNTLVIPNDISSQIAQDVNGRGDQVINISLRGANIFDDMSLNKITNTITRKISRELRLAT